MANYGKYKDLKTLIKGKGRDDYNSPEHPMGEDPGYGDPSINNPAPNFTEQLQIQYNIARAENPEAFKDAQEAKFQGANSMSPEDVNDVSEPDNDEDDASVTKPVTSADKIKNLTALANAQFDDMQRSLPDNRNAVKENLRKKAEAAASIGENSAIEVLDKYQQKAAKAAESAAELSRLGLNLSDADSMIAQTSVALVDMHKEAMARRAEIDAKQAVGLFDNPLEYIINQFTLPGEIKQHNAIVRKIAAEKQFIDQTTSVAKEVAGANALKYTEVSLTGAKAAAEVEREKAHEKVLDIQDKMLDTDYNYQIKALNIIQGRINNLRVVQEQEDRGEARRTADQIKNDKLEAQKRDDQSVMVAAKILGFDVPDRKTLDKSPKPMKEVIEYVMANGGGVGSDPLQAQIALSRGDPTKMSKEALYQRNTLNEIRRKAEKAVMQDPLMKTANPKQRQDALSAKMTEYANQYADDPNFSFRPTLSEGGVDNPYHIPPPQVMNKLPDVQKLPLTRIMEESKKALPQAFQSDGVILELAYANIGKWYKDQIEAASDVAAYYRAGVAYNNEKMRFDRFGMNEQQDYKFKGMDLTKTADIVKYYISKKKKEFMHPDFGMFAAPGVPMKTVEERIKSGELK